MKRFIATGLWIFLISLFSSVAVNAQSSAVSKEFFGLHIHREDEGTPGLIYPSGAGGFGIRMSPGRILSLRQVNGIFRAWTATLT